MYKFVFFFRHGDVSTGCECFDPKEPVSEGQAVQQAFKMLIADESSDSVIVFAYGRDDPLLSICTIT